MRILAAVFFLMMLAAVGCFQAQASDADTVEAVNQAAADLDKAFEKQDVETVKKLMTPDHVAVTPYYDGVQTVADQIASLPDLKYGQTVIGEVTVELLDSDAAPGRSPPSWRAASRAGPSRAACSSAKSG
jgi:hypothetical protein